MNRTPRVPRYNIPFNWSLCLVMFALAVFWTGVVWLCVKVIP